MRVSQSKKSPLRLSLLVIVVGFFLWWIFFKGSSGFISPLGSDITNNTNTKVIFDDKKPKDETHILQEIKDYVATQD